MHVMDIGTFQGWEVSMSRDTGPGWRVVRWLAVDRPGSTWETAEDRAYPPHQHVQGRRKRPYEYAVLLAEKQKLEGFDDALGGRCTGVPDRQDVPVQVDERMIVELYAR